MQVQAEISAENLKRRIGKTETVLIDEATGEDGFAIGRSRYEAPDIDGIIRVKSAKRLYPGEFVTAKILASSEHDLEAVLTE